ncbi:MAG: glycosyltransferase [Lachnospiraceae bacterium]|nr:glycosyltransferase [Lachnospiraceae bacterium]
MDKKLKISIIVPVHNATTTLERCLDSIIGQSYQNVECILIENGSTDDSLVRCNFYAEKYACIKVAVSEEGVSKARNLGLSLATGDVIGFCDADDFYETEAFSIIVDCFTKNPHIVGVISAFNIGNENEAGIQREYNGINKKCVYAQEAMILTLADDNVMGSVWNRFYRSDVAKKIQFDTRLSYCEDTHYNIKLLSSIENAKLAYIPKPLYCYMMNRDSVTHQLDRLYNQDGELKYISVLKKIVGECNLSNKCLSITKMRITVLAIDYLYYGQANNLQRSKLKENIKQNIWYFFRNITSFGFFQNLKRVGKLLLSWWR